MVKVKLSSKNSNLCDHNSPTSQTDRQTRCDRNTALCTKVHRAVKIYQVWPHQFRWRCDQDFVDVNPWRSPSQLNVSFPMLFNLKPLTVVWSTSSCDNSIYLGLRLFLRRNISWYQACSCSLQSSTTDHEWPLVRLSALRSKKVCL